MKGRNAFMQSMLVPLFLALFAFPALAQFTRTDLTTNAGTAGNPADPALINGWGLVQLGMSPLWISDNGTGKSTLYTGTGQLLSLVVTIPAAAGGQGTPTGIVGNISSRASDFTISENGKSGKAIFIFAGLDGTISGWNPRVDGIGPTGASHATIAVGPSAGSVNGAAPIYTGLAIGSMADAAGNHSFFLYAADDGPNRKIDMFDATFTLVKSFGDPAIPQGFTPYGIQNVNGDIWVTYTALNKAQGGFVDVFGTDGSLKRHFAVNGPLHSPWGIALAPADFGSMSNAILISNNTSRGRINAFDPNTGAFLGPLRDANGKAIEIDNVWAIQFGHDGGPNTSHNQLFFTAGPNSYANGLFGVITASQ